MDKDASAVDDDCEHPDSGLTPPQPRLRRGTDVNCADPCRPPFSEGAGRPPSTRPRRRPFPRTPRSVLPSRLGWVASECPGWGYRCPPNLWSTARAADASFAAPRQGQKRANLHMHRPGWPAAKMHHPPRPYRGPPSAASARPQSPASASTGWALRQGPRTDLRLPRYGAHASYTLQQRMSEARAGSSGKGRREEREPRPYSQMPASDGRRRR